MSQSGTFSAPSGMDMARLFPLGSDTITATAASIVPGTNDPTLYTLTFSGVTAGVYRMVLYDGGLALAVEDRVRVTSDAVVVVPESVPIVLPVTGIVTDRSQFTSLQFYVGETQTVAVQVVDANGVSVDVEDLTLSLVFELRDKQDVVVIEDQDITKDGSTISFALPADLTDASRKMRWSLRTDESVLVSGTATVEYAPKVD